MVYIFTENLQKVFFSMFLNVFLKKKYFFEKFEMVFIFTENLQKVFILMFLNVFLKHKRFFLKVRIKFSTALKIYKKCLSRCSRTFSFKKNIFFKKILDGFFVNLKFTKSVFLNVL